jgi:hypothetical protein
MERRNSSLAYVLFQHLNGVIEKPQILSQSGHLITGSEIEVVLAAQSRRP